MATMQPTTIATAANEYFSRPADERFPSLQALIDARACERAASAECVYNLKDLRAIATGDKAIQLVSPKGIAADFTHYSFGQLARTVGAPAGFLRELPAANAAADINAMIAQSDPGTAVNALIRRPKVTGQAPTIRACTSDTYGRVWDDQLYGAVARFFGDGATSSAGGQWQTPPVWGQREDGTLPPGVLPAGNYAGDRDSMVIRVDGGSIVHDPRGLGAVGAFPGRTADGRLYRGIMIGNSEVGAGSVWIDCVLFDFICGNHYLWGAVIDRKYRRRHVGHKVTRDTIQELITMARAFNQRTAADDEAIIRCLVDHEIAATKEGVIDELRKLKYTKDDATAAYERCESADPMLNPRSFWGIISGTTRLSQDSGYSDGRLALDQLAAAVAKRGQLQYA